MKPLIEWPGIRQLHARRLLFPVILGTAVVGVLVHGIFHPTERQQHRSPQIELPLPAITVPSIRPSLEKSPLTYHSDYWWQLAELVRNKIVLIGPHKRPGVMVAPGVAVTSMMAADELESQFEPYPAAAEAEGPIEDTEAATPMFRVLGIDIDSGIALIAVKQSSEVGNFTEVDMTGQHPGSYVVAISSDPDGNEQVVPGYVASVDPPSGDTSGSIDFAFPFPESCSTAAIVDLDGKLVAVTTKTDHGRTILPADRLPKMIQDLAEGSFCQAIEVGDLDEEAARLLGVSGGVLVERVHGEAFMPEPSIRAGDILLRWGDAPVTSADEYRELYRAQEPGAMVRYRVRRNGRNVAGGTRMPDAACRPVRATVRLYPKLGASLEWDQGSWEVLRVVPGTPAKQAGIEAGDRIVAVGGRELSERDATVFERFEVQPRPLACTIRRGDRVNLVVVPPEVEEPEEQPAESGDEPDEQAVLMNEESIHRLGGES
jgi:S1-C subfamily serine protease